MYASSTVCFITASIIKFSHAFLLNIRVRLIDEVPWCSHKTLTPLVFTTFKVLNGICLAISIPQASAIVIFIVSAVNMIFYIYF